jgi:exosortase
MERRGTLLAAAAAAATFTLLFWPVLTRLVAQWAADENYSHGFLIFPLALWFAWDRRHRASAVPVRPSRWGLAGAMGSLLMLFAGVLGAELFLTRIAMLGMLASAVVFLFGWGHLRVMAFPIGFLLLMVPLPGIVFNQIAFPLQLIASQAGQLTLGALDIPVMRQGNLIILAETRLEVAEACSGIRSLVSLLALGLVYGYFSDLGPWSRALLAVMTVPVAIVANALRVAGTGFAAHYYGPAAAEGFFHAFSGWLVFAVAFAMLVVVDRVVRWADSARPLQRRATAAAA